MDAGASCRALPLKGDTCINYSMVACMCYIAELFIKIIYCTVRSVHQMHISNN